MKNIILLLTGLFIIIINLACTKQQTRTIAQDDRVEVARFVKPGAEPPFVQGWEIFCSNKDMLRYLINAKDNTMDPEINSIEIKKNGLIIIGPYPNIIIQPGSGCLVNSFKSPALR